MSRTFANETTAPRPSTTAEYEPGKIPATALATVWNRWKADPTAARSFNALAIHAYFDGIGLNATGFYRDGAAHEAEFRRRYTTDRSQDVNLRIGRRTWNGETWYLRTGMAQMATPGTSRHEIGIAGDLASELDGDIDPEYLTDEHLAWLDRIAPQYGIYPTVKSERWHWVYLAGDAVPASTLGMEALLAGSNPTPPPPPPTIPPLEDVVNLPTLRIGAQGPAVFILQALLTLRLGETVAIDGAFGRGTDAFVRKYQTREGLTVDGIVGPQTWTSLAAG
jgi:Putative peptidoglycan binding domain/D-alanyl-D-alanine carboxypeptidase